MFHDGYIPPLKDSVVILFCLCERPKGAWQSLFFK